MLGTELAVRAAEIRPDLPILYMSGYTDPLVGARYQISDPERIVQKPFSREHLLTRVRDTLNRATH
jgi:CheY-like chemotaxis protein